MKKVLFLIFINLLLVSLIFTPRICIAFLSYNLSEHTMTDVEGKVTIDEAPLGEGEVSPGVSEVTSHAITKKVPKLRLSPSINLNIYVEEVETKKSTFGVVPGIGYGLRWNPKFWENIGDTVKSNSFIALDVYIQMTMVDDNDQYDGNDYFTIDMLPSISIIDWFSIGYGVRFKRSQHKELDDEETALISFGIRKGL